jgi:hypothetical protein
VGQRNQLAEPLPLRLVDQFHLAVPCSHMELAVS